MISFIRWGGLFLRTLRKGRKIKLQAFQGCDGGGKLASPGPSPGWRSCQPPLCCTVRGPVCSPGQPLPGCAGRLALVLHPCRGCPSKLQWVGTGGRCGPHLTTVLSKADLASLWNVMTTLVAGRSTRHCFRWHLQEKKEGPEPWAGTNPSEPPDSAGSWPCRTALGANLPSVGGTGLFWDAVTMVHQETEKHNQSNSWREERFQQKVTYWEHLSNVLKKKSVSKQWIPIQSHMLIHLYRCAFHNSQRLLLRRGINCVMLLFSSLLLCLQQACGLLGFLAKLYLVSGSTLVLDRKTHAPHLARLCHPRCQSCRLLWEMEGWLGLWAHQLPFYFQQHWKNLGPGWIKSLQIAGRLQQALLESVPCRQTQGREGPEKLFQNTGL